MTGDQVTFDYEGKLTTGETFDSSFERGEPLSGDIEAFVPGFTEALKLMKPGDEWIVWIPPALGYGEGEINEADLVGETLVFVVDILGTQHAAPTQ